MDYENDIDTGVSEEAFEQDPVLVEYQTDEHQNKWLTELAAARKERAAFNKTAAKTIERYADIRGDGELNQSHFNIFYQVTDNKQAALYARTPEPDIKRRFNDAEDDTSRVAAAIGKRLTSYELECEHFDREIKQVLFDRLVPGFGVGWVRFEQEEQEGPVTFDAMTGLEVQAEPVIVSQSSPVEHVAWDDFMWAPCRVWSLCPWISRRVPMSKDAVKDRFGSTAPAKTLEALSFEKQNGDSKTTDVQSNLRPKHTTEATVDVYEIWDKTRRLIWWICEGADVPLDVKKDTNEFPDFFPTPLPPLGRFTTSNTLPVSDFSLVQDLYNELDDLNNRIANLVRALKLRFMYDASNEELKDLFTTTAELEGVPVKNMAELNDKGGLEAAIRFAPLAEIAATYQTLAAARDLVKAQIYEVEGASDIMRAVTVQYESAEAVATKTQFGMTRLNAMQRELAEYIASLLRLKFHLVCRFYTPEIIVKRIGVLPQPDQALIGQALQLLKSPDAAMFRLSVSTDSISLPNWNQEKAEKTQAVQALSNLLPQLIQAAEKTPAMGMFGAQTLKWLVTGFKGSEEIEGFLDQALEQMTREQQAKAGQPPQPTPAQLEAQAEQAKIQADLQKQQIKGQIDVQVATIQSQAKVEAARLQAEVDSYKTRIKEMEAAMEARFRQIELQIEATRAAHENAKDVAEMGMA